MRTQIRFGLLLAIVGSITLGTQRCSDDRTTGCGCGGPRSHRPVPRRGRGDRSRVRARLRQWFRQPDHHRLHRPPVCRRDGLPLLQQGADRRPGDRCRTPGGAGLHVRSRGQLRLVAVEYVVPGAGSNPPGVAEPPIVLGMQMHILVPAVGFYIQHVWVWSHNPAGMFVDWNPELTCPRILRSPADPPGSGLRPHRPSNKTPKV